MVAADPLALKTILQPKGKNHEKVLLTTTALVMTVAAAADITFSGAGEVGMNDGSLYTGYDFNVALSAASDNGMTFAMGFDMGAGSPQT